MRSRFSLTVLVVLGCLVALPSGTAVAGTDGGPPRADNGPDAADDGGDDSGGEGGDDSGGDSGPSSPPVACDGALCDTTNGASCSVAPGARSGPLAAGTWLGLVMVVVLAAARRRRLLLALGPLVAASTLAAGSAAANERAPEPPRAEVLPVPPPPAVDVALPEEPSPRRPVAAGWNPLPLLTLGTLSTDLVLVPIDHHALVISAMVAHQTTAPFWVYDDAGNPTQLPKQSFASWGGEIGYRHYGGLGGARGFFLGPSLLLAAVKATAADGTVTDYGKVGLAVDAGFSALLADRIMVSLGGGLQYAATTRSIPSQQWPVNLYANGGVRPRVLVSIGWAF